MPPKKKTRSEVFSREKLKEAFKGTVYDNKALIDIVPNLFPSTMSKFVYSADAAAIVACKRNKDNLDPKTNMQFRHDFYPLVIEFLLEKIDHTDLEFIKDSSTSQIIAKDGRTKKVH